MLISRRFLLGLLFASFCAVMSLFFDSSLQLAHFLAVAGVVGNLLCAYAFYRDCK
jgi:hypothetical protein